MTTVTNPDDDWYIPNSDDESLETIELTKEQILQYILELNETGTLALEWKCPGRRPLTPPSIKSALPEKESPNFSTDPARLNTGNTSLKTHAPPMSSRNGKGGTMPNDYDFSDISEGGDSGAAVSIGAGANMHKKFGSISAAGNRKHKLKSTDSSGSSSSAVTLDKVMSDLMRQEREDKRNIDQDRIAKGLPTLSEEEEELKRKREDREEAFRQVANSVVSVATLRQNTNNPKQERQKKLSPDGGGGGGDHRQQSHSQQNSFSAYSIASLSANDDRNKYSESSVKQMVPNDSFSMAMGALGGGVGGNGAAAAAVTSAMTPQTMAQIQESLQHQLMPNSFVSALDNLPTSLFPTSSLSQNELAAALQTSNLLPGGASNQQTPTCNSQGMLFTSNHQVNSQLGTSVAALSSQLQNQTHFFNENEATTMLSNALSAVAPHDLLGLSNFPSDLASFDRGDGPNWN